MDLVLLTATIICLAIFLWLNRPDPRLPPFPKKPLPIVGNLLHLQQDSRVQFKKWRKQCGDIFSVKIVGTLVVVLNGYDVIKEVLVKKADVFSDRTPVFFDEVSAYPKKGVLMASGHNWKEQRSVAISILRKFGMGKNKLAEKIQEEVSSFTDYLASIDGKPTDIHTMTTVSVSNIICSIIIGHRFEYDDESFQSLIDLLTSSTSEQKNVSLINFVSWLKYLPGDFFMAKKTTRSVHAVLNLVKKFINLKKSDDVDVHDDENFVDAYKAERNKKIKAGLSTFMDDENLLKIIIDLFYAGTETTSTAIYWCILYMLNYPDIQEKVYREIEEQVGTDRTPNMQNKSNLPYLNAVIMETLRLASIIPLSITHMCSENVTHRGFVIPKGTYIVPNLDSVLHDETIWGEDVMTFKPERFLDADGKLQEPEELIPFGIGRRVCLGEALARMELFLFLSNMFQRFQFIPRDAKPPTCKDYIFGITCSPQPYEVRIVARHYKQ